MSDDLNEKPISELRKIASAYNIPFERDWTKPQFVSAINARKRSNSFVEIAGEGNPIPEGHARIRIIPTSESRQPAPVFVNNYSADIPIDVEVDIPIEALSALQSASRPRTRKVTDHHAPAGYRKEIVDIPTYTVNVLGVSRGIAKYPSGKRKVSPAMDERQYSLRQKFREVYGKWPNREEFKLWKEQHMLHSFKNPDTLKNTKVQEVKQVVEDTTPDD